MRLRELAGTEECDCWGDRRGTFVAFFGFIAWHDDVKDVYARWRERSGRENDAVVVARGMRQGEWSIDSTKGRCGGSRLGGMEERRWLCCQTGQPNNNVGCTLRQLTVPQLNLGGARGKQRWLGDDGTDTE